MQWHGVMETMLGGGFSAVCPNCQHEFPCCPPPAATTATTTCCTIARRSLHALSGGGLVSADLGKLQQHQHQHQHHHHHHHHHAGQQLVTVHQLSPQISPSAPLAFILPFPVVAAAVSSPPEARPETELKRLADTVRTLKQSGWYHEGLSWQQSQELLKDTEPGTFLVRDSSDPRFLYSLSVQTRRGPTSIRLHYVNGMFRLDAESHLAMNMPLFPSVLDLVQHYVDYSRRNAAKGDELRPGAQVWIDSKGSVYANTLLTKPLLRQGRVPRLQHLARLAINGALASSEDCGTRLLELPPTLRCYLEEYPYTM